MSFPVMWAIAIILAFILFVIIFFINFYRDPKRKTPKGNIIVAPADGRVISIIKTKKDNIKVSKGILGKIQTYTKEINDECYVISIFMSPFDVHINRSPVTGTVKSIKHSKGRFFRAYDFEKSFQNEKNEIVIQNKTMKVKVIQIAGFLARRIICNVKPNQKVNIGSKIGMIALGSQTTIVLPKNMRIKTHINQKVIGGETILAVPK